MIKDWLGSRPTSLAICCQGLRRRTKSLKGGEVWAGVGGSRRLGGRGGEKGGGEGESRKRAGAVG